MLVLSQYKYSLLQGSQASQHQLRILATCHGLKYFCEKERGWLFATAFAGRAKTQSLGGTEVHPGSPAALKDFIPSQCPCCRQCSCLATPSLGFISGGKNGRVLLPGSFAAYTGCWKREGAGGFASEALSCSQGLLTAGRYPAAGLLTHSASLGITLLSDPRLRSLMTTGRLPGRKSSSQEPSGGKVARLTPQS